MLASTLRTLKAVPEVHQVLVISRDMAALALARDFGARTVQEDGSSDLNTALKRATVVAQMYAASSVLILPADLPLIDPSGMQAFIQRAVRPPVIVIAPDRRNEGTNALLVSPVGLIDYQYGKNSFKKHTQQAEKYNLRVEIFENPAFALDLDLPEDLDLLREIEMGELGRNSTE
jgi:2-phospho-L-lactate guanylyltransferase